MLAPQSPAGIRKGTKSCTECRRRKVRCVRIPEDAPTCRQCAERNTACLAQTSSARPRQAQRLPSRLRIAQLESQVSRLTKVVSNIEVKLGGNPSIQSLQTDPTAVHSPGSDDSDAESTPSEILIAEEPTQLRSLFQNDLLSVDTQRHHEQLQERRAKASANLRERVRPALQKLIPSKEEAASMLVCSYDWLQMLARTVPQPAVPESYSETLARYEEMCGPDVDVVALAGWLLVLAITAHQIPQGATPLEAESPSSQRRVDFARSVSDTVENLVLAHDRLAGTLPGLGMCIQYVRLQMARGYPQKAWLKLRHAIALAELMGLPKAAQSARFRKTESTAEEAIINQKANLWDLICTVDRLASLLLNLPPYTRRYKLRVPQMLVVNGDIQPAAYLSRLMDITPKIYDLEDLSAAEGPTTKMYTSALEIAREARELAAQLPQSWWAIPLAGDLKPDHIVQYMHFVIVMKAHLPVALRQDRTEEYLYSRLACMDACESLAQRFRFIRSKLPSGFFTLRLLDLQAFAAMASLLLLSHTCPSSDIRSFQVDKARIETIVTQVIELMEEKSKENGGVGSDFAERGAQTLLAMRDLLGNHTAPMEELTANVPLLGKIHIRRNLSAASDMIPPSTSWPSEAQAVSTSSNPHLNANTYMQDTLVAGHGTAMQWEPLTWSVEDGGDNLLENALIGESFDQAAIWQDMYYNLPFL